MKFLEKGDNFEKIIRNFTLDRYHSGDRCHADDGKRNNFYACKRFEYHHFDRYLQPKQPPE